MQVKKITIANCCNGNLEKAFQEAIGQAAADIDRRGAACLDPRKVILTVELKPNDQGYIEQTCYSETRLPKVKYGGMAKVNDKGGMDQITSAQLDAFDEEGNIKIVEMKEETGTS